MYYDARSGVNPNLAIWLERHAALRPGQAAIRYWAAGDEAEDWSYAALQRAAVSFARYLTESGIRAGDRVAFLDLNDARFAVVMFAAARIGAVFVPLNFRLAIDEIVEIVNDCEAGALVYGDQFEETRKAVQERSPCRVFLRSGRGQDDELGSVFMRGGLEEPAQTLKWDDCAWLLYTSGSTGRPKGVMLSHGNIFWNTLNVILAQGGLATDKVLISAPLFHAAPVSTFMESFLRGATIHLERSFDAARMLRRIQTECIAVVAGVPAMYKLMAEHPSYDDTDLSSLRALVVGGAPVHEALIRRYRARGVSVIHRYGLTEATVLVSVLPYTAPEAKHVTAGIAPLFSDFRIVDEGGGEVPAGMRGEIEVRGPNVMQGYWKREHETAQALRDGWLRTGDLGQVDEDGYLAVTGRSKDMIISGGENIHAVEVEARLQDAPGVLEAAVIGVPDEKWGETVCAILSLKPGAAVTEADVLGHLDGRLARYKLPRKFVFLDALPKNGAGKIDKRMLRATYAT